MMLLLLAACGGTEAPLVAAADVWVEDPKVGAGEPVVLHAPTGTQLPEVEGLSFTPGPSEGTWEVRGAEGSYVLTVAGASGSKVIYLDIGVDGPKSELDDIATIPPPEPSHLYAMLAGAAVVAALLAAAVVVWRRTRPPPPPPPPEPAEVVARREWARLRGRTDLAPDVLAAELSGVFRRYLQAIHQWPATSRTSREILDALAGDLPAVQLERARRLLFAMDIVRFSDRSTHADFFAGLDEDFEALLVLRGRRQGG
jgi:hypothetical protein